MNYIFILVNMKGEEETTPFCSENYNQILF